MIFFKKGICKDNHLFQKILTRNHLYKLSGYQTIRDDEILMKTVIDKVGPIIVSLNSKLLDTYKSGSIIDDSSCPTSINHNALAVGYGYDPILKIDYWIVKNSWGSQWGDQGYFKIARGKNMCGIGKSAIFLCPDYLCSHNHFGLFVNLPKENYQCGGKGYIGPTSCANSRRCVSRTADVSQCFSSDKCPDGWVCGKSYILLNSIIINTFLIIFSFLF